MDKPLIDEHIATYYAQGVESGRLLHDDGAPKLELARTLELFERFAPAPPADVLDVGGGPGVYSALLAARGYHVRLIDAVELHVQQASEAAAQAEHSFEVALGDARRLEERDGSFDIVLLLGPLYHLVERSDRVQALAEAHRVVRPGGHVFAAAISRFASLLDGLRFDRLGDQMFQRVVERDLRDGQHRSPDAREELFTTAYFHKPEELKTEVGETGLELLTLVSLEGPAWLLERRDDALEKREVHAWAARAVEAEPTLLGLGPHLLAVARKP